MIKNTGCSYRSPGLEPSTYTVGYEICSSSSRVSHILFCVLQVPDVHAEQMCIYKHTYRQSSEIDSNIVIIRDSKPNFHQWTDYPDRNQPRNKVLSCTMGHRDQTCFQENPPCVTTEYTFFLSILGILSTIHCG